MENIVMGICDGWRMQGGGFGADVMEDNRLCSGEWWKKEKRWGKMGAVKWKQ